MNREEYYMQLVLELAARGLGTASPNPMVGAVIVNQGELVGKGFHKEPGGEHAEVAALRTAGAKAEGGTLYVNLEPCNHYSRTPPCTEAILKAGIKKVVMATEDPNPRVSGSGKEKLLQGGVEIKTGVLEKKARRLNEIYIKYITTGKPFVLLKWAMTLDGKIATREDDSRWISGEASRKFVHHLRHLVDGIVVGIGTVLKDDPALTTRIQGGRDAARIILDTKGRLPLDAKVINPSSTAPTWWVVGEKSSLQKEDELCNRGVEIVRLPENNGKINLYSLLQFLSQREIASILIEGGGTLNYGFFKEGLVDKIYAFIAPLLCGGKGASTPIEGEGVPRIKDAWKLKEVKWEKHEADLLVTGYPERR